MALDPDMKALLDQMAEAKLQSFQQMTPAAAREQMARRVSAGDPVPIGRVEDRMIPGPNGEIPIRIYTPEGRGPFGALVYFHGGGWVVGNIEMTDQPCRMITKAAGCVVVSVDYRLAPEHKFPAGPEDCYAATKWAAAHAGELDADAAHIVLAGDSAGGNMVAVTALMARDRGGPALCGQLMIVPVTDYPKPGYPSYVENAQGYGLTAAGM